MVIPRPVCVKEMSESEPLMTYRKDPDVAKTEAAHRRGTKSAECSDDRAAGDRYMGGMTLIEASRWNVGTFLAVLRERGKWHSPRALIPMRDTGAEQLVVAMKCL